MDTREQYRRKGEAKLKALEARFELLKARAQEESAEVRAGLDKQAQKLKATLDEGRSELEQLAKQGEEALEQSMARMETLWDKAEGFMEGLLGRKGDGADRSQDGPGGDHRN